MDTRSTNYGFASPKDIMSNVGSSHGVWLRGGSTGGIIEAAGDDANVTLTLRGKGTGSVVLGNSSSPVSFTGSLTASGSSVSLASTHVHVNSTRTVIGAASTTAFVMAQRYRIDWTIPALSSAGAAGSAADSTVTVLGLTTNSVLLFGQKQVWNSTSDPALIVTVRCSTADELKITTFNVGASTISGSTKSGMLLAFEF